MTTDAEHGALGAGREGWIHAALRAVRPHHWTKNLLVLVPVASSHQLGTPELLARGALAAVAFSLAASAGYLVNDALDAATDRAHPRKRARPFASGALPRGSGLALVPVLLAGAAVAAGCLPASFAVLLGGYLAASVAYSAGLKRAAPLDVIVLAGLYMLRVYAGAAATGIAASGWLGTFSMFLFLSLALLKRTAELAEIEAGAPPRRGYGEGDREPLFAFGTAAGYVSVLVLALYVSSADVARLYARPQRLWLLCPLLLFWLTRLWLLARRGRIEDDPLVFTARDAVSWAAAAAMALVVWAAA